MIHESGLAVRLMRATNSSNILTTCVYFCQKSVFFSACPFTAAAVAAGLSVIVDCINRSVSNRCWFLFTWNNDCYLYEPKTFFFSWKKRQKLCFVQIFRKDARAVYRLLWLPGLWLCRGDRAWIVCCQLILNFDSGNKLQFATF